jgi:hypothetical protein
MPRSSPWHSSACSLGRFIALLVLLLIPATAHAQADLLVIPFIGLKLGGQTSIAVGAPTANEKKVTFGGSVAIITPDIFGIEADVEHTPHFFGPGLGQLISQSNVTTLMGNVVFTVPKRITRESLRPYLVGGVGLMHVHLLTQGDVFDTTSNLLGLDVGGGAIGFVSPRAGVRFDLRRFKNLTEDTGAATIGGSKLSFWRLTAGMVLEY